MNPIFNFKTSLLVAAMLVLPVAQATTITKVDLNTGQARISAEYKADKAACATQAGNAKDVCIEEAKAKEAIANAELQYEFSGKPGDQTKVAEAKAKSGYAVAKEKCDDQAGNAKDVCVKEAKAVEAKMLADAKMGKQIGEAQKDDSQARREADYKVAVEKCDALAGDTKTTCAAAAKSKLGKN